MHDPILKSFFADRRIVEILIRDHVPEWADEIDFATLRQEPAELVARKTLQTRHPDMIWSAEAMGGGRVLFLIEFQRKAEQLMALRTTTYTALALVGIATGPDFGPGDASLDAFVVERLETLLELRDYTEALELGGAKTMDELTERFQQGLEELVQRGARQGRQQGRLQGQAMVLRRLIARRFGEATAGQVSDAVEELTGNERIDKVTDALFECGSGDEFIERVRTA